MGALRAGTSMGSAATASYRLGQETSGSNGVGAGLAGVGRAGAAAAKAKLSDAAGLGAAAERGRRSAMFAGSTGAGASSAASGGGAAADEAPHWARRLRSEQNARHHRHAALQAVREGDRGGAAATPDISERED
jgi:type IV secretion system protein TrbL